MDLSSPNVQQQKPVFPTNRLCDGCRKPIPAYPYLNTPAGFVSPLSDEQVPERWRKVSVEGIEGWENIPKVVCLGCFIIDFKKRYPNDPMPLDPGIVDYYLNYKENKSA